MSINHGLRRPERTWVFPIAANDMGRILPQPEEKKILLLFVDAVKRNVFFTQYSSFGDKYTLAKDDVNVSRLIIPLPTNDRTEVVAALDALYSAMPGRTDANSYRFSYQY